MNAKLTRIHLGLDLHEMGVQFELDDGAGGTVTQRAFLNVPDAAASIWSAAQAALSAKLAELPASMPPGAVTTALMAARNARQEAAAAQAEKLTAEDAAAAMAKQLVDLETRIASRREELAAMGAPL